MKTGIATYNFTKDNYGQILQCYALQQALIKVGCEPFLLETKIDEKERRVKILRWLKMFIFSPVKAFHVLLKKVEDKKRNKKRDKRLNKIDRSFDKFREQHIKTDRKYTMSELRDNVPQADFYVCGSDQVWAAHSEYFFLDWVKEGIPCIAYAPSFGRQELSDDFSQRVSQSLQHFNVVTVREKDGVEICRKAGRNDAIQAPDPTLLLSKNDYERLFMNGSAVPFPKKYVLVYLLGWQTDINFADIEKFAEHKSLEIVYVPSIGDNVTKCYNRKWNQTEATVEQWLALVANAEFVITNSFHGTVFSLIFNKLFAVYLISGEWSRMNNRVISLMQELNIQDRIVSSDLKIIEQPVDYTQVNTALEIKRNTVYDYFKVWFKK
jgi:hypothetical protein